MSPITSHLSPHCAMAAIAAVTVTVHKKLPRVWPRVEFPSDFDEGLVARNLIDCAKTGTAVCTLQVIEVTSFRIYTLNIKNTI